jgi:hypothetical protein
LKPKVGGAYASVFRCASQNARISKSGLVIEFARALNENEKEILKVRGMRLRSMNAPPPTSSLLARARCTLVGAK